MMRVLVTGSRTWPDAKDVHDVLGSLWLCESGPLTIVHGDCPKGVDRMARDFCERMNSGEQGIVIQEERHSANWDRYGKRAGFVRNSEMVSLGANLCIAFIHNGSKGASMTADLAEESGITVLRLIQGD